MSMAGVKRTQDDIDSENSEFWNTLCGSWASKALGINDDSPASLKIFDDWYLDYYPYLTDHVPVHTFSGKRVLEVGLGYGTMSQKIAEAGADYLGMDIAAGPVGMVRHRLRQAGLPGDAVVRSFLDNQLEDASFDAVVAIGCFHHTGNVQKCFDETLRILKDGGTAHLMVYNRYSHRRYTHNRAKFMEELVAEEFGDLETETVSEAERAANDRGLSGEAAPETVFLSKREIIQRMSRFSQVRVHKENMDESADPAMNRKAVLKTWGVKAGLDLYINAVK